MKKKPQKNKKIIITVFIVIAIVLVIIGVALTASKEEETNTNTPETDLTSVEEVAKFLECQFIKEQKSTQEGFVKDEYIKIRFKTIEDGQIKDFFYKNLIEYVSKALGYVNYRIIDESQNIIIEVYCNSSDGIITGYTINGDSNYFETLQTQYNVATMEDTTITNFTINSSIINYLINNSWQIGDSKIGTQDSTFDDYKIFFDEGVEVRKIDGKVFNLIFTKNYKSAVVSGITTNMSNEEITAKLGTPTFKSETIDLIGYKGTNIYVFFFDGKISIYRANSDEYLENVEEILNNYAQDLDFSTAFTQMQNDVPDYDYSFYYGNNLDVIYSLKGIKISTLEGIVIYKNYIGNIFGNTNLKNIAENLSDLPKNVSIKDEDLVFLSEERRIQSKLAKIDNVEYYYNETADTAFEAENRKYNKSSLFYMNKDVVGTQFVPEFISLTGDYADSQLIESVDWAVWLNDYIIAYGIKNKGIYTYNAISRKYATVVEDSSQQFEFVEYENNLLKYDDNQIEVK